MVNANFFRRHGKSTVGVGVSVTGAGRRSSRGGSTVGVGVTAAGAGAGSVPRSGGSTVGVGVQVVAGVSPKIGS